MEHIFNPSTWEAETGRDKASLVYTVNEFQDSQCYMVVFCLKRYKKKKKKRKQKKKKNKQQLHGNGEYISNQTRQYRY